ncbi:hypothetical protein KO527_05100 [Pseudoalteromonas sp. C2R02]|uniref:hypothetical protein n=1 Tax=Pseudoalteromonas sp. C2R02 TaxID=2841565 RepID=UPI001C083DAE|nr:hypothetical protein [Pseudoalteromonas sp. C2R02]MBU2968724.1 hypothetical protein [Pseudoalteromonas sp. C2R02]
MEEKKGLMSLLRQAFTGFNPADNNNNSGAFENQASGGHGHIPSHLVNPTDSVGDGDILKTPKNPEDRASRYALYDVLAKDASIAAALDIHTANALSTRPVTGEILMIEAANSKDKSFVDELRNDLQETFNNKAVEIANIMAIYGCNFAKPHFTPNVGLTSLEHDFFTLPHSFKEYVRGGEVAGYTSEHMELPKSGSMIKLIQPWELTAFKIPYWQPDICNKPLHADRHGKFTLMSDPKGRTPIETQNYGTSFLANSYQPYADLAEGMLALQSARRNTARLERVIAANVEGMDSFGAADFINLLQQQLRNDESLRESHAQSGSFFQTRVNSIIPTKGSLDMNMNQPQPNIKDIEDIMFSLRRLASTLSIDVSMLGWGDLMSGGLGEGGFLQTSIQALTRANWLRKGLETGYHDIVKTHTAYKHKQIIQAGSRPYRLSFNSMNTAIELKEAASRTSNADFALQMVNLMAMMAEANMDKPTQNWVLTDMAGLDEQKVNTVLDSMASKAVENEQMLASAKLTGKADLKERVKDAMIEIYDEIESDNK